MRRDAAARRESLLTAAAECFARGGYLVPLEEIADRAGVGRGTLYRNFRDRLALVFAIFDREVRRLEEGFDRSLPLEAALTHLALGGASASALFARIGADLPLDDEAKAAFEALGARLIRLLEPAVAHARDERRLHPDVGPAQVFIALRMIGGLLKPSLGPDEMRAQIAEALPLVMTGLGPRPAG